MGFWIGSGSFSGNSGIGVEVLGIGDIWRYKGKKRTFSKHLGPQSFTSLKADLRQDIHGGFALSRCLNGIFPLRQCSVNDLVS